ncbi:MAG: hypothetical protein ABI661_06610 [Gammaproteobacteria bacterium]
MVPLDKPPLPHPRSHFVNIVRGFAILGFVGFVLLFSMILAEGKVRFPLLQANMGLVVVGLTGMLLTYRHVRLGGVIMLLAMVGALALTPRDLLEWRPWLLGTQGYAALLGLLFLLAPRAAARNHGATIT